MPFLLLLLTGNRLAPTAAPCLAQAVHSSKLGRPASPPATAVLERDCCAAIPGPIRALHVCALAPVTNVKTAAAGTGRMTPRHCRGP